MSPYRVLISTGTTQAILQSMLSVDKTTQNHYIYIVEKESTYDMDTGELKVSAHRQSTKKNTMILAKYEIHIAWSPLNWSPMNRYELWQDNTFISEEFTQQDCITAAMNHYCKEHNISILHTL